MFRNVVQHKSLVQRSLDIKINLLSEMTSTLLKPTLPKLRQRKYSNNQA